MKLPLGLPAFQAFGDVFIELGHDKPQNCRREPDLESGRRDYELLVQRTIRDIAL